MEKRDYLMRQVEQLGQVLAVMLSRLLGIKQAGSASLSIEDINSIYRDELDITLELIINTPREEIIEFLNSRIEFINKHLEKIAEILTETAGLLEQGNQPDQARDLREKCIFIYEHLQENSGEYSLDRVMKISQLREAL